MTASETRKQAREYLSEKWGKGAFIILIYSLLTGLLLGLLNIVPLLGAIACAIIEPPLIFGLTVSFIKLKRNEDVSCVSFFVDGFSNFEKVWFVIFRTAQKLLVYLIIMIVCDIIAALAIPFGILSAIIGGSSALLIISLIVLLIIVVALFVINIKFIMKSFLYALSSYILYDNPDMTALEIVNKSEELMMGNRWKLFCLSLSFIGWAILCIFTLGIGYLFLMSYIQVASIVFYENLLSTNANGNTSSNNSEEDEYEIVSNNSSLNVEEGPIQENDK